MASNAKILVRRIIEPGNRHYTFGLFQATGYGGRQLVAVVEGSYQDAVKMVRNGLTESGNTYKGFKKVKT